MVLMILIRKANEIVAEVKSGKLDRFQANVKLEVLSKQAWKEEPNSEPDGDIEYMIATAGEEIDQYLKMKA